MKEYVKNKVLELRKNQDITQEQFAKAIGVTRQTVIAIEKGVYIPSLLLGLKIARYFKKTVEEIFTYKNEK
ncbi:MAG: hypothetical protein US51_C0041G0004 [Microgenomates group bacterium GW2011_GWA2_37_6]|nr:MAG: hypothetical protein US51_C0041G0004 [Microgenomates group bacterium GW2011_GWA2_37_6]